METPIIIYRYIILNYTIGQVITIHAVYSATDQRVRPQNPVKRTIHQ